MDIDLDDVRDMALRIYLLERELEKLRAELTRLKDAEVDDASTRG